MYMLTRGCLADKQDWMLVVEVIAFVAVKPSTNGRYGRKRGAWSGWRNRGAEGCGAVVRLIPQPSVTVCIYLQEVASAR